MSVGSSMLKLDREIESVNVNFSVVHFHISFCCHSLFMKEEDDPFFYGKSVIGFQNGREEGALFACQPFFLLDSQVT